jgi:hypothetical protein
MWCRKRLTPALNGAIDTTDEDWTRVTVVNNEIYYLPPQRGRRKLLARQHPREQHHLRGSHSKPTKGRDGADSELQHLGCKQLTSSIDTAFNPAYHPYNNLIMGTNSSLWLNGVQHFPAAAGTYDGGNVADAGRVAAELGSSFVETTFVYDAHLIAGARAIGFGISLSVTPPLDLNGDPRGATIDAGALQFGSLP